MSEKERDKWTVFVYQCIQFILCFIEFKVNSLFKRQKKQQQTKLLYCPCLFFTPIRSFFYVEIKKIEIMSVCVRVCASVEIL